MQEGICNLPWDAENSRSFSPLEGELPRKLTIRSLLKACWHIDYALGQMNESVFFKFSRHRISVYLLLAFIVAFNFAIRWQLRDLPLERDEGEYAYAGQLILQGIPPYQIAYNMKFPGTYFAYAALMAVFGQSAAGIHLGMMVVTSISAILLFFIGRELMGEAGGLFAAATFVCLSALPKAAALAGHATHFVSLFVCAGVLALLMARKKNFLAWWLVSGGAFGLALLTTQQAIFFPVFILAWVLWKERGLDNLRNKAPAILAFCCGCALPLIVAGVVFACAGVWGKFIFWTIQYAHEYVSIFPLRLVPEQFALGFDTVFESGMWVWASGVVGLFFLFRKGEWEGPAELAGILFLAGMAAVFPGFYFRNHYFIMAMPGLSLLNAVFILGVANTLKKSAVHGLKWLAPCLALFILGNLFINNCKAWFAMTPLEVSRQLYSINPFPESIPIAAYLKSHTSPGDTIAVLGSEPQIFFLSHRHSASGYLYLYPLTEPQPLAAQMGKEFMAQIETARPAYVVFVNLAGSWYSVVLPESFRAASVIQQWWGNYSTNYTLVGTVKISPDQPSQFLWDRQLTDSPGVTNADILIYHRK